MFPAWAPKLKWQPDGPRYFLDGEPVHAGDILEARMSDGAWTTVRPEYSWDCRANTIKPYLIVPEPDGFGGTWERWFPRTPFVPSFPVVRVTPFEVRTETQLRISTLP